MDMDVFYIKMVKQIAYFQFLCSLT